MKHSGVEHIKRKRRRSDGSGAQCSTSQRAILSSSSNTIRERSFTTATPATDARYRPSLTITTIIILPSQDSGIPQVKKITTVFDRSHILRPTYSSSASPLSPRHHSRTYAQSGAQRLPTTHPTSPSSSSAPSSTCAKTQRQSESSGRGRCSRSCTHRETRWQRTLAQSGTWSARHSHRRGSRVSLTRSVGGGAYVRAIRCG